MKNINVQEYQATEFPIHKAVQSLAFLGKKLGEDKADDSQTTISYDPKDHSLIGKPLTINNQKYRAALRLEGYDLVLDSDKNSHIFLMQGRTIPAILKEIREVLKIESLPDFNLHYDLPEDYDIAHYTIVKPSAAALTEWASVRQFAAEIFEIVNTIIEPSSPINIWPHHFDTGTYHVLSTDEKGDNFSVGCGFAVADTISEEPYFYIYGWSRDTKIDFSTLPKLPFGEWKTGDWKGAIMPLSVVLDLPDAKANLRSFYETTFQFYTNQLIG